MSPLRILPSLLGGLVLLLSSCYQTQTPPSLSPGERVEYLNQLELYKIDDLFLQTLQGGNRIVVVGHQSSPEALELLGFIIPFLYQQGLLNLTIWF